MIVAICYFQMSVKSVFILVQCNTSLNKLYVEHSTVVWVMGWVWEKGVFCHLWLSVRMESVVEQRFFHEFAFDIKALKTVVKFWICWKCSFLKFDWTLSNLNSNLVTSLDQKRTVFKGDIVAATPTPVTVNDTCRMSADIAKKWQQQWDIESTYNLIPHVGTR